ncbi:MAG: alcohol dehydrogenase catalytic domain-containing protein [Candidatus Eremiobacteraeota bacterium]|nr:alcohol dehydrogenase catalytic domain-containing protein [Candidatus Eremiobacteraeota bacterium]MBV8433211.1 alcohol dehydrogenase catalytic domain-containing protein [Candidatus Eremiobacteraeota bacterium]MBV8583838.1 alcohol dehydrogenase catalytic domain-containing protein [Candidatus Eremiobacteraeota bacterium]MBV8656155.1 alcohol dehydrogenase catalytic domain-containing protein [Candidatus Eremiobacteraeota bacterium]
MKATVYHGARDVRLESVDDPVLREPTDAIVRVTRAAICGSDLWFYRGITQWDPGDRTGHEFVGIVEEAGKSVSSVAPGDLVIAPFVWSDGTCEFCKKGLQTSCVHGGNWGDDRNGAQAEAVRVPQADGTLVKAAPEIVHGSPHLHASAAALCDVMPTGHHGVVSAQTQRGGTVAIVGDGAVGLCAVLSAARVVGAERVIAIGHNPKRLARAREFGATHAFDSHEPGIAEEILELTRGGSPAVVEAVGNQESMDLAAEIARPGGTVAFVGAPNAIDKAPLRPAFVKNVALRGALAPARSYIDELMRHVVEGSIDPSRVFDLTLPLDRVTDGYEAMDRRRAIKVLLEVSN